MLMSKMSLKLTVEGLFLHRITTELTMEVTRNKDINTKIFYHVSKWSRSCDEAAWCEADNSLLEQSICLSKKTEYKICIESCLHNLIIKVVMES